MAPSHGEKQFSVNEQEEINTLHFGLQTFLTSIFFKFIYFESARERVHASVGGRERERQNPEQAPCTQHRARCGGSIS